MIKKIKNNIDVFRIGLYLNPLPKLILITFGLVKFPVEISQGLAPPLLSISPSRFIDSHLDLSP